MIKKIAICLLISLTILNPKIKVNAIENINRNISSFKNIYLQNIYFVGNNQITLVLPPNHKLRHIHPFSFVSPSGQQLIHLIPQSMDANQSIIKIYLRSPITEKGTYKIEFVGVDKNTYEELSLIGELNLT